MTGSDIPSPWTTSIARRTYVGGTLAVAGLVLAALPSARPQIFWLGFRTDTAALVLLASAAAAGWNFFPKGVRSASRGRLDMNVLMTIAIVGALLIGEAAEAAAIAVLFSFAELLESAARTRARRSIEELVRLVPQRARIVVADGAEEEVPIGTIRRGMKVRVRPGERIAIDGTVLDGESSVDQATVTGESVPVPKRVGDRVLAGSMVVEGFLELEATTDAGDTTLDRIVSLVRSAQASRAPTEHFVDRFARIYTPAVFGLAVLVAVVPTFMGLDSREWIVRGLTLLVIACPCALVIATPVTVVSAITSAARRGVLIKGGEHLETLGRVRAMAFDKTGSLTLGRLSVTDVEGLDGRPPEDVIRLAGVVEQRSEHPIGQALIRHAEARGVDLTATDLREFSSRAGHGVIALVGGQEVRVGTPDLLELSPVPARFLELEGEGKTVVVVGEGVTPIGLIALSDEPRPEARDVVERLRRLGVLEMIILTGDNPSAGDRIGKAVGIVPVKAGLLPEEKVAAIEAFRERCGVAAMLGDGVNDAPALATADVGIVMGAAGSPASIEAADVALMRDDLRALPEAFKIGQRARRLMRFNIGVALGAKGLLAVGAVLGMVPLFAAVLIGDVGASLVVTINAMRLGRAPGSHES